MSIGSYLFAETDADALPVSEGASASVSMAEGFPERVDSSG
jgi:hypothetical protein